MELVDKKDKEELVVEELGALRVLFENHCFENLRVAPPSLVVAFLSPMMMTNHLHSLFPGGG